MDGHDEDVHSLGDALQRLIETYQELNPSVADEVFEEPSALEFMQYVSRNRPLVIRGGAQSFKAIQDWSADYLNSVVGDCEVNVSITPHGNADSVLTNEDGSLSFVKPYERNETFRDLITYIQDQEKASSSTSLGPTKYGQTQNDNLRNELLPLFTDVPSTGPPFARIALGKTPDAINFWLGNSHSTTSLHRDNYENIYVQVRGRKHFVLLPAIASAAVNERGIPASTYCLLSDDYGEGEEEGGDKEEKREIRTEDLEARLDHPPSLVNWALWDPDTPDQRGMASSKVVKPVRVTLEEGDMLYLPALWYHKVGQSCGEEGFCCAVNYWYDMEFTGNLWATNAFVKDIARLQAKQNGVVGTKGPKTTQADGG